MNNNYILQVTDLSKTYRKIKTPVYALKNVCLKATKGNFISIVGRSGSGKSTLLNLIGGLDTPTSGTVAIAGRDLSAMNKRDAEKCHGLLQEK